MKKERKCDLRVVNINGIAYAAGSPTSPFTLETLWAKWIGYDNMGFNVCIFNGTQIACYVELQLHTLHTLSPCLKKRRIFYFFFTFYDGIYILKE